MRGQSVVNKAHVAAVEGAGDKQWKRGRREGYNNGWGDTSRGSGGYENGKDYWWVWKWEDIGRQ